MITLCDTSAQVSSVLPELRGSAFLLVDLEGRDLGCLTGALSIISIGTDKGATLLFDIVHLGRTAITPVLELLADECMPKFMWDGRKDVVELHRTFPGAQLEAVVDLQLVDVLSRRVHGEGEELRVRRLTRKGHSVNALRQLPTKDVHGLISLKNALSEHKLRRPVLERRFPVSSSHAAWMVRPLSDENVAYAAEDINLLSQMHAHFLASGYLDDDAALRKMTARYLQVHASPVDRDDIYQSSDLLPHDIIDPPKDGAVLYTCNRCKRELSSKCFVVEKRDRKVRRLSVCKVCNLVDVREELPVRKEELKMIMERRRAEEGEATG